MKLSEIISCNVSLFNKELVKHELETCNMILEKMIVVSKNDGRRVFVTFNHDRNIPNSIVVPKNEWDGLREYFESENFRIILFETVNGFEISW